MSVMPVVPIQGLSLPDLVAAPVASPQAAAPLPFAQMLTNGLNKVNTDQVSADNMVRAFALDDSVPLHQVTYALEQARLSLEMALQVRSRLLEGYQQIMNMQL
jgi:flagellar hook-basal body complex protein FliE